MSSSNKVFAAIGEFSTVKEIWHACEKVRDSEFTKWDAHTPFPVHGLEHAMGMGRSRLPFFVFAMGITGAAGAFALQSWISTTAYPIIIAAKPYFSWQAFIPVTFEVMVLFSAGSAVLGMLFLNRLPRWWNPLLESETFKQVTNNKFIISIEASDPKFDPDETQEFLRSLGASKVELVEE
ncbi:MAG TPA: DUF3341 domain-containing protein [Myxococcales bacterium LLY-WYZ-16_1]|nr:DUF3341 domain-containing protein [Myxococcales bacterium LLY-WYZ-16_1]